jgi:DNA-binding protein HU-beta
MPSKTQIIDTLASQTKLNKKNVIDVLKCYNEIVLASLMAGKKIKILSIGSIRPVAHKARNGFNPKTGEQIKVPAKITLKIFANESTKEILNK